MTKKILENAFAFGVLGVILLMALQHPSVRHNVGRGHFDFISFYSAGAIVRDGRAAELYRQATQDEYQRRTCGRPFPLLFYHPPFEALVFVPLSFLAYWNAYQVWAFVNLALGIAACLLLRRLLGKIQRLESRWGLVLAFMLPFVVTLMQGQDSLLLLVAYSAAFVSLKERRDFRAGGLLALGLFRPQLVLPFVLPFLLKRQWRFLGGFAAVAVVLSALSVSLVGVQGVADWVGMIRDENIGLTGMSNATERTVHPQAMASLRGLLFATLAGEIPEKWVNAVAVVTSALLFAGVLFRWRGDLPVETVAFDRAAAATVVATLLVSFHLYPHDLSLLLLPLAAALAAVESAPRASPFGGNFLLGAILAVVATFVYVFAAGERNFFLLAVPLILVLGAIWYDLARTQAPPTEERPLS